MPYIEEDRRESLTGSVDRLAELIVDDEELNYVISRLCHVRVLLNTGVGYETLSRVMGVLQCVTLELYRTVVAPQENLKRNRHGRVSILDRMRG